MLIDDGAKSEQFVPVNEDNNRPPIINTFPPGTKKDESFDIQAVNSNAWRGMPFSKATQLQSWLIFFLMGVLTGAIAFGMDRLEEFLVGTRAELAQKTIGHDGSLVASWSVYSFFSTGLVAIAAGMSIWWGPGAIGSGVAETMGIVNGYNYHDFIGINTLVTKIFGVVLAVSGGMKVGKEGPLAHIGSLVGVACIYIPWSLNKSFRNDRDKRAIIAAGAGVGVSVAFGAPIGGVLFAYEVSKANAFWTFTLAWKTFLSTSMANFTLTMLNAIATGNFDNVTNAGLIKFGDIKKNNYDLPDVIIFIIIGVLGGLLGALFIEINMAMGRARKRLIKKPITKFIEALAFAFVGSTLVYYIPSMFDCITKDEGDTSGI